MTPDEFIAAILPAAKASALISRIPAGFTVAQAAVESSWAKSQLTHDTCNLFGIKADGSWHGPSVPMETGEHLGGVDVVVPARWRKYPDWQASIDDHVVFLRANKRYAACFNETTAEGWAHAVQAAGYSTNPKYAELLISVMHFHNLAGV